MTWFRSPLVAIVPAALGLTIAGVCSAADTRPSNDTDWFRNQQVQPPTGDPTAAPNGPSSAGRDFGPGAPPAPPRAAAAGNESDFPSDEVHDWVVATARAAHARAILHRAEHDLDGTVRDAQFSFEQSHDYHDAAAAEKQAYEAYTAERQRVLQSLMHDPKYQAALQLRDRMTDRIAALRASSKAGEAPREMLLALASQKLQFASDARAMEDAVLEKDDALRDARQRLVQASARTAELRNRFDTSIRFNPQIMEARRSLDDARVALITAEAYRDAAAAAGTLATDYTYYRHRWDQIRQGTGGGPGWGAYGYGW